MIQHRNPVLRRTGWTLCALLLSGLASIPAFASWIFLAQAQAKLGSEVVPGSEHADSSASPDGSNPLAGSGSYRIGPGDLLAINVWKDPEISRTMPVRPDGHISLPLVGELQAAGLTAAELQQVILQKLEAYISHPAVNVIIQEIRSRNFNIVGRVNKAGVYDLSKPMTVLDAIAEAGGFQDFAHVSKIYVLRQAAGNTTKMLPFNYKQVVKGRALAQNIALEPGDTIVVP